MFKKITVLLALCLAFTTLFVACNNQQTDANASTTETETKTEPTDTKEEEPPKKSIDIYLIAGQSNASGYTIYDPTVLERLWDKYNVGNESVLYFGRAEFTYNINTPIVSTGVNEFKTFVPARAGMGALSNQMGPEVGMAAYLNEHYYNEPSGKQAGIIKFAHGGTSLLDNREGENAANGNWVSPSYAKSLNVDYTGLTGGLYRGLLDQVQKGIQELEANGYEEINFKGMFWMQGESDTWNPQEYKTAFRFFANDLREDLGKITGKDQSDFAIMIGEISKTSGSADTMQVMNNNNFIFVQRALAAELQNTYVIASGQFEINTIENGVNVNGQDAWHWTTEHMFSIGELVGECIVNEILK